MQPSFREPDQESSASSDVALMQRATLGDGDALSEVMRRHWRSLVAYATHLLDDDDAAQDAVQQAFARLWTTRSSWKPSGSVRGYLCRLVRNRAIDELRRNAVWALLIRRTPRPNAPPTPLQITEANEFGGALERAVRRLPRKRREVLVLAHLQGFSYQQIAEITGISPKTAKKHVSLALSDLRRALAGFQPVGTGRVRAPAAVERPSHRRIPSMVGPESTEG